MRRYAPWLFSALLLSAACKGRLDGECAINDDCNGGQVCEAVDGEASKFCVAPLIFTGKVTDLADGAGVAGAQVSAVDENGAPASEIAEAAADGSYRLTVFSRRANDEAKTPLQTFTLRAAAGDFEVFPQGVRVALPINAGQAELVDDEFVVDTGINASVDIALLALPANEQGFPRISGNVEPSGDRGVLVVAEANGVGVSALSDLDGDYTLFNVPPNATYTVRALAAGIEYDAITVDLAAEDVAGADLALSDTPTLTDVPGNVQIVNAPGGSTTSVIVVLESTFDALAGRGDAIPGLRAPDPGATPNITGDFTLAGLPDGNYVVLAAFENDGLVRDPDPNIGGTQVTHIRVADGVITLLPPTVPAEEVVTDLPGFKITAALEILGPGAGALPEAVTEPFNISWVDDSSEEEYALTVFKDDGTIVFDAIVPGASGENPSVAYAGDPLEAGRFYQVRVSSLRQGAPISTTEDLRGVFFAPTE